MYKMEGKGRALVAGPHHQETLSPYRIVNAVRDGHAFGVAAEVVIHDQLRVSLPASPGVLEISNHLLFFRIDADDGVALRQKLFSLTLDVGKLLIAYPSGRRVFVPRHDVFVVHLTGRPLLV